MHLNPRQAASLMSSFLMDEDGAVASAGDADLTRLPERIGPYEVTRLIGVGGMGVVFEGRQQTTGRRVAIKLIRSNVVSTAALKRFQHEVRMLARLHHPGIAQIYEAGADDSGLGAQPYFAMEYVDGAPLGHWAAEREPELNERLELFVRICDAVQYAHQRGVIHRDLKPTNILIDDRGDPHILDFGVARTTDDQEQSVLNTRSGQLMGTLPYMSPEQIAGDGRDVDTRSDVYALGVLLFELLTDQLPYELRDRSIPDAARIIQEQAPTSPAALDRSLRGDLETILLKSLEKEPQRRYQSAGDLAGDLRRYLSDQPIIARPPSAVYALRKYVKRNKGVAAAVTVAVLGVSLGLVFGTWQFAAMMEAKRDAADKTRMARVEADAMRAVSQVLTDLIAAADPANQGRDARVIDVLRHADSILASPLVEHPRVEIAIRTALGRTYLSLGDLAASERHLSAARKLAAAELDPKDAASMQADAAWAQWLLAAGRPDEAGTLARDARDRQISTLSPAHADAIDTGVTLGRALAATGQLDGAYDLFDGLLRDSAAVHGDNSRISNRIRLEMGDILRRLSRLQASQALLEDVFERQRRLYGEEDPLTIEAAVRLGHTRLELADDPMRTSEFLWLTYGRASSVLGQEHPVTLDALFLIALANLQNTELEASEEFLRDVFELRRERLGDAHPRTLETLRLLGQVLIEQGYYEEAERFVSLFVDEVAADSSDERSAEALNDLGLLQYHEGDYDAARGSFRRALEQRQAVLGDRHPDTLTTMRNLALTLRAAGDSEEAATLFRTAVETWRRIDDIDNPRMLSAVFDYAETLRTLGRVDDANALYEEVVDAAPNTFAPGSTVIGTYSNAYGRFLLEQGRYEQAERRLLDAFTIFQTTVGLDVPVARDTTDALERLYRLTNRPDRIEAIRRLEREDVDAQSPR